MWAIRGSLGIDAPWANAPPLSRQAAAIAMLNRTPLTCSWTHERRRKAAMAFLKSNACGMIASPLFCFQHRYLHLCSWKSFVSRKISHRLMVSIMSSSFLMTKIESPR
jgi:hypothetical protein